MSKPYTGGCACGAIRYEIAAEPLFSNDCQCRDCQHESGTGHGSYLTFPRDGVKLSGRGDALGHGRRQRQREDARLLPRLRLAGLHDVRGHARSLHRARREPRRSGPDKPQVVTYGARGHAWDHVDPALPKFDRMPRRDGRFLVEA